MKRLVLALLLGLASCKPAGNSAPESPEKPPESIPSLPVSATLVLPKPASVVGIWAAQDGYGGLFNILLLPDGRVISTLGNFPGSGQRGQWKLEGNEVLITYPDGGMDHLVPNGNKFLGCGSMLDTGIPDLLGEETPVTRVLGERAPYVGVWRLNQEPDGSFLHIALQSDGTASSTIPANGKGKWTVTPEGAKVTWADGWTDIIAKQDNQFTHFSYPPEAAPGDSPADKSEAVKVGSVSGRNVP